MPHQKLIRVLNYVWLLVVFPVAVAIIIGILGHSATLGFKTFLLIECEMAVLRVLTTASRKPPLRRFDNRRPKTSFRPFCSRSPG
jgi:hypothetical protein